MPNPAVTAKPPIQSAMPRFLRRDEIGQAQVRAFDRLVGLLAQVMKHQGFTAVAQFDIVAHTRGWPESDYRFRAQPFLRDDLLQDLLRVVE